MSKKHEMSQQSSSLIISSNNCIGATLINNQTQLANKQNNSKQAVVSSSASFVNHTNGINNNNNINNKKPTIKSSWNVKASTGAMNTTNPIREIIETMNLAENPNKKVIPLSIGDPTIFGNLKPCKEISESLQRVNLSGKYYGYQTAAGMEVARDAVADYHFKYTGNKINRHDVILASGCSHAIDLSICVLAEKGQNILIPRPGFPLYKTLTSVYDIQYKQYNLLADENWSIDLKHLESLIDENTAAIIVNNPSNPCGSVFSKEHLLEILEVAELYKIPIIADEIYDKFVFSEKFYPINRKQPNELINNKSSSYNNHDQENFNIKQLTITSETQAAPVIPINNHSTSNGTSKINQTISDNNSYMLTTTINDHNKDDAPSYQPFIALSSLSKTVPILTCGGISKTCLIPGLRLGWIIINDRQNIFDSSVRNGLNRLTQRLMGPNSLVQGTLQDILTSVPESFYSQTMDFIYKNAKLVYDRLKLVKGLRPHMPQGSMYLMVHFDEKSFPQINGDLDFVSKLMNEESVLVLPGKCFDFPNYFRLCLTVPMNIMDQALDRMKEFCSRYYKPPTSMAKTTTTTNGICLFESK